MPAHAIPQYLTNQTHSQNAGALRSHDTSSRHPRPFNYTASLRGCPPPFMTKSPITLGLTTPASIPLEPGEVVIVTYSSAPTAVADRK